MDETGLRRMIVNISPAQSLRILTVILESFS